MTQGIGVVMGNELSNDDRPRGGEPSSAAVCLGPWRTLINAQPSLADLQRSSVLTLLTSSDLAPFARRVGMADHVVEASSRHTLLQALRRAENGFQHAVRIGAADELVDSLVKRLARTVAWIEEPRGDVQLTVPAQEYSVARGAVVLDLGHSPDEESWSWASWNRFIRSLPAGGPTRVLVGGPKRQELGRELVRSSGNDVVDLTGLSDLGELSSLIAVAELLVSGDPGALRLAEVVGTPSAQADRGHSVDKVISQIAKRGGKSDPVSTGGPPRW